MSVNRRRGIATGLVTAMVLLLASMPAAATATPRWSILQTPRPKHTATSSLAAVSCISIGDCTAVGNRDYLTLAERWDGSAWSVEATADPPGADEAVLFGVACTSAIDCDAVGYFEKPSIKGSRTLAEHWNGAAWSVEPTPQLDDSLLSGIACVGANDCAAVGYFADRRGRDRALAEHWDGVAWSIVPMPNPPHAGYVYIRGVSCLAAADCTAVGAASGVARTRSVIEHWDGAMWSIVPSPNPPDATHAVLLSSDCTSAVDCWAVGQAETDARLWSLVEHWDGTSWSIASSVPPIKRSSGLVSIVCTSQNACMAVGNFENKKGLTRNLAERWDGRRWEMQRPPAPLGAFASGLESVACVSDAACIAVGSATDHKELTLAERYAA